MSNYCSYVNCNIVAVFGYEHSRNLYCKEHKSDDMEFTFIEDDFTKMNIYDMNKKYRICIFNNCEKNASFNFLGIKKRLFCAFHKLETMVNVNTVIEVSNKNCKKCGVLTNKYSYNRNICKDCSEKTRKTKINNCEKLFFGKLLNGAKSSAELRMKKGHKKKGIFELTIENIQEVYRLQNGKCYYSGRKLNLQTYSDWQCSIERINPSEGYMLENIVLIAAEFQGANQWDLMKYKVFLNLLINKNSKQIIDWKYKLPREKKNGKAKITIINNIEHYLCTKCKLMKSKDKFFKNKKTICKDCEKILFKSYRKTPYGHMTSLINHMKSNSLRRKLCKPLLNLSDLIKLYDDQNGFCYYSGIQMKFGSYLDTWWTCSAERLNTCEGYTHNNTRLICYEFNTVDNSKRSQNENEITGSSSWSKDKIQIIIDITEINNLNDIINDIKLLYD